MTLFNPALFLAMAIIFYLFYDLLYRFTMVKISGKIYNLLENILFELKKK